MMSKRTRRVYDGKSDTQFDGLLHANYYIDFVKESSRIKQSLCDIPWTRVEYQMYAKTRITPRLTWCYGRLQNEIVRYRGKNFTTELMPDWLVSLRDQIAEKTGFCANACILNFYTHGSEHINWHADDETFLEEKTVASISLSGERVFSMRNDKYRFDITLRDGSLLMMYDAIEHCLEAQENVRGRFNITFRKLNSEKGIGNYYYYNRGLSYAIKDK
jgi:alkylated DNA repair dioxygenase AlkB